MKGILKISFIVLLPGFCSFARPGINLKREMKKSGNTAVAIRNCQTDKGSYRANNTVRLSFSVVNNLPYPVTLKSVVVNIVDLKLRDTIVHSIMVANHIVLVTKQDFRINHTAIWTLPNDVNADPYGVFIRYILSDGTKLDNYQTFFRVIRNGMLTKFDIQHFEYHRLKIFALDGGMSAEYAIEKSGESLAAGMSHSWKVNGRGSGPNQVFSTPQFLENSVKETVSFYDNNFGSNAKFENVIISTGIPSVPYLARAIKSPVLPLHFLVSSNTVKEIQTILNYSNKKGYSCYSTLGYDSSVPNEAVAWVKLLDIPKEYIDFLIRHYVRHVIILGATSPVGGEATAKKVTSSNLKNKYDPGSLFLLYPQGGVTADVKELKARVMDYDKTQLQNEFTRVADWESGIISEQVKKFSTTIKHSTSIKDIKFITSNDDGELYNLATYVTLSFIHKNSNSFTFNKQLPISGIMLNPYLIANPVFESRLGYIPYVYWQGNSAKGIINEMTGTVKSALSVYFPHVQFNDLNVWINSSLNFGGAERALALQAALLKTGINHIKNNDYSVDEIWNPTDGIDAPCELKTQRLLRITSVKRFKKWNASLKPLTPYDLYKISQSFPSISITKL